MKEPRQVVVNGEVYLVPPRIQRMASGSLGWQVRYQGSKYFDDCCYGGAGPSLKAAEEYSKERLKLFPLVPKNRIKENISASKSNHLPLGITGAVWSLKPNGTYFCEFKVFLPKYGGKGKHVTVYIGTHRSWAMRFDQALRKASQLRRAAIRVYRMTLAEAKLKEKSSLQEKQFGGNLKIK